MRISFNGNDWQFKGLLAAAWQHEGAIDVHPNDARGWHTGTVPGSVQHDLWQLRRVRCACVASNPAGLAVVCVAHRSAVAVGVEVRQLRQFRFFGTSNQPCATTREHVGGTYAYGSTDRPVS